MKTIAAFANYQRYGQLGDLIEADEAGLNEKDVDNLDMRLRNAHDLAIANQLPQQVSDPRWQLCAATPTGRGICRCKEKTSMRQR